MSHWLMRIREENESGFTMVELMVIVTILGILTSISVPIYLNQKRVSVDDSVQSDLRNAALWLETWGNQNPNSQVPPITLQNTGTDGLTKPTAETAVSWTGPLKEIKLSPKTTISVSPGEWGPGDDGTATKGSFTIQGTNPNGKQAKTTSGIRYSSAKGGL